MHCTQCERDIPEYANFCYGCGARQQVSAGGAVRASKRLMRSSVDRKIAGVCGGLAEYWEVDSTIVRLACILPLLIPMPILPGVVLYAAAWMLMPVSPLQVPAAGSRRSAQTA